MGADRKRYVRLNLPAGSFAPKWADEVFWKLDRQTDSLPPAVPGRPTGYEFNGWVPGEDVLPEIATDSRLRFRLAGSQFAALLNLPLEGFRSSAAIDASDPELLRGANIAVSAGVTLSITYFNPSRIRWRDLTECWHRLLKTQKTPVAVQPFVQALKLATGNQPFSLRQLLLQRPTQEIWGTANGGLFALPPETPGPTIPLGDVSDGKAGLLAQPWFSRVDNFEHKTFRDGLRCSTCPGYRACGGYLELFGEKDCE